MPPQQRDAAGNEIATSRLNTNQWRITAPTRVREIRYTVAPTWTTRVSEYPVYRMCGTVLIDSRQRREILQWLTDHSPAGRPLGAVVLGTTPHPSGGGRVQTFLRVDAFGSPVIRLIWQGERVVGWSDGIRLPAFRRYKPTSTSTAVSFSPRERDWQTLRLDASGETLQIQSTNGTSTLLARRILKPSE